MTEPNGLIHSNLDYFVTETTLDPHVSMVELLANMKRSRWTGELRMVVNQGGIQKIVLTERKKMTEDRRTQVRAILHMD
jgi:hypothetical protein